MEREVGGGIGMGNTCKPMAVSFKCMTKFTKNKKKKQSKKKKKEGCQWRMEVRDADIFLVYTRQPPTAKNDPTQMTSGKESTCNAGDAEDMGSMPGSERSSGRGHANPLQYSYLESSTDKGAWRATVHGEAKSQTRITD